MNSLMNHLECVESAEAVKAIAEDLEGSNLSTEVKFIVASRIVAAQIIAKGVEEKE